MSPKVIADSDDENSENGFASARTSPAKQAGESVPVAVSTSHNTSSTDPAFFETVFNEQQAAAEEENGNGATCQDNKTQEDVWNIPSSPDAHICRRTPRRSRKGRDTTAKVTRRMRQQLEEIGYVSDEEERQNRGYSSRKRRKIAPARLCYDDEDASVLVAPASLSASQKRQYRSTKIARSSSPTQALEPKSINVLSSGSATNINTPRTAQSTSLDLSGSNVVDANAGLDSAPTTREIVQAQLMRPESPTREEGFVPPGCHDGNEAAEKPVATAPKKTRGRPKKKNDNGVSDEKASIKAKKKRGRPKKADTEIDVAQQDGPAETVLKSEQRDNMSEDHPEIKPDLQDMELADQLKEEKRPESPPKPATGDVPCLRDAEDSVPLEKGKFIPPSAASTAGRPLYRVGLSKRMRIAPLLKSVPK